MSLIEEALRRQRDEQQAAQLSASLSDAARTPAECNGGAPLPSPPLRRIVVRAAVAATDRPADSASAEMTSVAKRMPLPPKGGDGPSVTIVVFISLLVLIVLGVGLGSGVYWLSSRASAGSVKEPTRKNPADSIPVARVQTAASPSVVPTPSSTLTPSAPENTSTPAPLVTPPIIRSNPPPVVSPPPSPVIKPVVIPVEADASPVSPPVPNVVSPPPVTSPPPSAMPAKTIEVKADVANGSMPMVLPKPSPPVAPKTSARHKTATPPMAPVEPAVQESLDSGVASTGWPRLRVVGIARAGKTALVILDDGQTLTPGQTARQGPVLESISGEGARFRYKNETQTLREGQSAQQ